MKEFRKTTMKCFEKIGRYDALMNIYRIFNKMSEEDLRLIWQDYAESKKTGKRCESFVKYARMYKSELYPDGYLDFTMIIDIIEKQFFIEIAERHFGKEE